MAETSATPDLPLYLEEPGLWVQNLAGTERTTGRPALFLDRDGTINVDTGYPRSPDEIVLLPKILPVIRAANAAELPAIIVSNQSGVARGLLDWRDFAKVNQRLLELLAAENCAIAMVLACAYHEKGRPPLDIADHPMRKPNPGMFRRAAVLLGLDLAGSIVVGDKASDMEAGRRAGVAAGWLIGDEQADERDFATRRLRDAADYAALERSISASANSRS